MTSEAARYVTTWQDTLDLQLMRLAVWGMGVGNNNKSNNNNDQVFQQVKEPSTVTVYM